MVADREQHDSDGPDPEGPSASDLAKFGGDTRSCPACGEDLYDDAAVCSGCGHALSASTPRRRGWVVALVVLFLIFAVLGGLRLF